MRNLVSSVVMGLSAFVLSAGLAFAEGKVDVSDARLRLLPGDVPAAGYFRLHNGTDEAIKLIGAHTGAYRKVMMHLSMEKDGMAEMHAVPEVDIAPGEDFEFAPSGYHLMFMKRSALLQYGDKVTVILKFADRKDVPVNFKVVSPAAM
ncbi:copper chaperone PCu(A)C [Marinobacter halodurans]|uniref:copper chaperone PCu(A)C n=1 Tax=Marinobacter halodurans TaxID=2528979 RepID=UPI001F6047DE|nr:copper chaperone PCu(A)C [Marinobacter halodurans]